jgi:integrase
MAAKLTKTNTPGIFRRHIAGCGGGRCHCAYVVVWRHRGTQHTATFPTLSEAREGKGNRDAGDTRPASREQFADYVRTWLDSYRGRTARGLAERTRRTYRRDMERWAIPYFRGRRLDEVEPPDVRAFVRHLERADLRPASIRAILAPVKAMYATAVEDGTVRFNPTRGLRIADRRDPADDQEARALTRAELTRLLDHLPERWRLLFEFLAHTGLRISEAVGLTWADVEFGDRPRLRVRRQDCRGEVGALKSEHSRRDVPLSPRMARRLWALGADQPGTDRVLKSPLGLPLTYGNLRRRVLIPATRGAGLGHLDAEGKWRTWVTFHTFRHTCASLLFDAGRDVKQVATWLGHGDPAFTLRTYVHLMDDGIGDAAFMDDAVRVNTGSTRGPQRAANPPTLEPADTAV